MKYPKVTSIGDIVLIIRLAQYEGLALGDAYLLKKWWKLLPKRSSTPSKPKPVMVARADWLSAQGKVLANLSLNVQSGWQYKVGQIKW